MSSALKSEEIEEDYDPVSKNSKIFQDENLVDFFYRTPSVAIFISILYRISFSIYKYFLVWWKFVKCAKKNWDDTSTVKIFNIYERNQCLLGMVIKSQIPKGFKAEHYYKLKNTRQL